MHRLCTQFHRITAAAAALIVLLIGLAAHGETDGRTQVASATLRHSSLPGGLYTPVTMHDDGAHGDGAAGDGVFGAEVPAYPAGTLVHYMLTYKEGAPPVDDTPPPAETEDPTLGPIVINEFMASNATCVQDPQGDYDDWLELLNVSEEVVDLSGMYLSDSEYDPTKWSFPEGTTMAPGECLLIWADDDTSAQTGLHTNFKLSSGGETILLVDADSQGNELIDSVTYGALGSDVAYGRYPDGHSALLVLVAPTPGERNSTESQTTDFDDDGSVGFADFLQFARKFGKRQGDQDYDSRYDLNGDGEVGFPDFLLFVQHFS
jgi:hypothetical protein